MKIHSIGGDSLGDIHSFSVSVAEKYGVNAAILLRHISFWIEKNRANGKHFHDGRYWTYNSRKAFMEMFPYMTDWQVRSALQKLVDDDILLSASFNSADFDRTRWYALTEKGEQLYGDKKITNALVDSSNVLANFSNANGENHQPIPDSNTFIETDIGDTNVSPAESAFADFWKIYPRREAKQDAFKAFKKLDEKEWSLLIPAIERQTKANNWTKARKQFIPLPATWLNGRRWEDEVYHLEIDDKSLKAARWLAGCIKEKVPDLVEPSEDELERWAADMNYLHSGRGYRWKIISDVAAWAIDHRFWGSKILSGNDLAKNFDRLLSDKTAEESSINEQ